MGTNCAPLVADLFLFCYERDFMMSLSDDKQADVIDAFNITSRYLDDILNIKWFYKRKIFYGQVLPFCTLVSIYNKHYGSDLLSRLAACQRIPASFVLPSNQNRAPCLSGVGSSNVALLLENSLRPDLAQKNFR